MTTHPWRDPLALFLQKPVFWNKNHYKKPSGAPATSGYPKMHGYGHEEWNNSPYLRIVRRGCAYRVFHTEGVGNAPLDQNFGQTFVFMTASHDGVQQLVGIAANAVSLISSERDRKAIACELGLEELWVDAWDIPTVRAKHENSLRTFQTHWKNDLHWIPNWLCPEEYYWWLDAPITLTPQTLTGKKRLLGMYGSHTVLDHRTAFRFMDAVPHNMRDERWTRIAEAIHIAPSTPASVIEAEIQGQFVTDVLAQVSARRGQGRFRDDLLKMWGHACAVTGLDCAVALRASHVKPWSKSSTREKLDPNNGLILAANFDALFDAGLITFEDNGQMKVSTTLSEKHRREFGIPQPLRFQPSERLGGCRS